MKDKDKDQWADIILSVIGFVIVVTIWVSGSIFLGRALFTQEGWQVGGGLAIAFSPIISIFLWAVFHKLVKSSC